MKYKLEDCYYIGKISNHNNIRQALLNKINSAESHSINVDGYTISKTDWEFSHDLNREWAIFFIENCIEDIKTFYKNLGHEYFEIHNIWFQQYYKNSSHTWHNHGECNYSNVYYLELPKKSESTEIVSPFSGATKSVEAKEGEMLIFPAHIYHRAPANLDEKNRTVVVFNSSTGN